MNGIHFYKRYTNWFCIVYIVRPVEYCIRAYTAWNMCQHIMCRVYIIKYTIHHTKTQNTWHYQQEKKYNYTKRYIPDVASDCCCGFTSPALLLVLFSRSSFWIFLTYSISLRKMSRFVSIDICRSWQSFAGWTMLHVPNIVSTPPHVLQIPVRHTIW